MIVSYYILTIGISILFNVSQLAQINITENNDQKEMKITSESGNFTLTLSNVSLNRSGIGNPDVPVLFVNETTNDSKLPDPIDVAMEPNNATSPATESHLENETMPPKTDDMPTFVEYQQMLEKESKQKREKADLIPSNPTMIVRDNNNVKATVDSTGSQSLNRDTSELSSSGLSSQGTQESKGQNSAEKSDLKSGQVPVVLDEPKTGARSATLTKKLLKNNVAAKECGAKMLDFSRQITNADHVLNNNKDEYLNVPCSQPEKWFIIETCEPVQIRSIQIANFEMFSSRPKTFKVYSSDRYPVKHWYYLGLFRAHDEKGIQTFTTTDSNMVKYIKFEMVDHYGNEHYCPLTFVRILGNVVIDEIDDDADEGHNSVDEESSSETLENKSGSNGLLTKAKDILVKMVNGIGGSKTQDQSIQDPDNIVNGYDDTLYPSILTESPCYFIRFLLRSTEINCDIIFVKFLHFLDVEKHFIFDRKTSLAKQVISQPFPSQIRVVYFSIQTSVSNTRFQFDRLYHSFLNLTSHCSSDICLLRPWLNLSSTFKCNHMIRFIQPRLSEPKLPNITLVTHDVLQDIPPTVSAVEPPEIKGADPFVEDVPVKRPQSGSMQDLTEPSSQPKSASTSSLPPLSNETASLESSHFDKNSTIEIVAKDVRGDKIGTVLKEPEPDNQDLLNIDSSKFVANLAKTKPEDILDQKFLANPGSNAWNQAFMRIKNLAKQLEVNVTISMKYLEELSQNYKQQTERLKRSHQLLADNVSNLENLFHQYRQETQNSFQNLNTQLQALVLKIKFGFKSAKVPSPGSSPIPINLTTTVPDSDLKCVDLLSDELFAPSWWDSPWVLIFTNVLASVACNVALLFLVYNRLRIRIIGDIERDQLVLSRHYRNPLVHFSYVNDLAITSPSRSCTDLTGPPMFSSHPVVLPPRGVNLSFINQQDRSSTCLFKGDSGKEQRFVDELGPHFYAVHPNLNFVTPSKDKKKKRKK